MNPQSFLLGLLCLCFILSSCKKENTDSSKGAGPSNTREAVWEEIEKISLVSKFSNIDTVKVNQNIDNGLLTVEKLRGTSTSVMGGIPIMEDQYSEETYLHDPANQVGCSEHLTFTFWNLKSRGYPSVYTISWIEGNGGGHNLSYSGALPVGEFTFVSTNVSGGCAFANGWGSLEEEIFGWHRNWSVETKVNAIAATAWQANIKLTKID